MSATIHNFQDSLKKSHLAEDLPFWEECYRAFFLDFATMVNHRADGWWQRAGIDRTIVLHSSKNYKIDEKVRWGNYLDIALEELSSVENKTAGWVEKSLMADFIAYAIAPRGKCYLLPVPQLQAAWLRNKHEWRKKYPRIQASNEGYTTLSWGIPVSELFSAIGGGFRCDFAPLPEGWTP